MASISPSRSAGSVEVLVIGEALIDIVHTPQGTAKIPGGSPANVAYGLAKLGIRPSLWTALANDQHGDMIREHLDSAGVTVLPWATPKDRTSTSTVRLAEDGSPQYEFDVHWSIQARKLHKIPRLLHVGSAAAFCAPGNDAIEDALRQCHGISLVTFDPNIRPALIPPHAQSLKAFERIAAMADVVKLSDEDANWLYPRLRIENVAQHILELGPDLVSITQGEKGALLTSSQASTAIPAVPVTVVDTIGAGDSYMSALIFSLLDSAQSGYGQAALTQLGRVAAAAAAITVSRTGARPPSRSELVAAFA